MNPKYITVHCSATRPMSRFSVADLRSLHVGINGWTDIGYHFYITTDGEIHECRPLTREGAHVRRRNKDNIGICLEGGLSNETGKPYNTYSFFQLESLRRLIGRLSLNYDIYKDDIKGHRDWYGDTNGDGVIDSGDWLKKCPCFDVRELVEEVFQGF